MSLVIAIDNSGSTAGHHNYWNKVKEIVNTHVDHANPKPSNVIYYLWSNYCHNVSHANVMTNINRRHGQGGTCPAVFVYSMPSHTQKLVLITDGQIDQGNVADADRRLADKKIDDVEIHFLNTGGPINLSVAAPFIRNSRYQIYDDSELFDNGVEQVAIDLKKYYNNLDLFFQESEELLKMITRVTMGRENVQLRHDLLDLQKNLMSQISKQNSVTIADQFDILRHAISDPNLNTALTYLVNLLNTSNNTNLNNNPAKKLEHIIRIMTSQCENQCNFQFDLLQPGRLTRSLAVNNVKPAIEEIPKTSTYTFECPVLLDSDEPVLLISQGPAIFDGLDKSDLEYIISYPFSLLSNPDLVQKIKNRIDHVLGFKAAHAIVNSRQNVSPFTRQPLVTFMTFDISVDANQESIKQHLSANKYTLANIFFGQKLVGRPDIWLTILYLVVSKIEYLDQTLKDNFKAYLIKRITKSLTNITLTGLPVEPMLKAPIDIAIWYSIVSENLSFINNHWSLTEYKAENLIAETNRLRSMLSSVPPLCEILDLLGYNYNKDYTMQRLRLYRAFAWMMREENSGPRNFDKQPLWRAKLRALVQNHLLVDDYIIFLEGRSSNTSLIESMLPNFNLTQTELFQLATLVNNKVSVGNIIIPRKLSGDKLKISDKFYGYKANCVIGKTKISPDTFRPYVYDRKLKVEWRKAAELANGPLDKQISLYAYFLEYIVRKNAYPTKNQLLIYVAKREARPLPTQIMDFIDSLWVNYGEVLGPDFKDVDVEAVVLKVKKYVDIKRRAEVDGSKRYM